MTANTVIISPTVSRERLRGPEKWLAIAEARKKERKETKKTQTVLLLRGSGLTNSATRSQYFVDKYPLIEKTSEEWRNDLEEKQRKTVTK